MLRVFVFFLLAAALWGLASCVVYQHEAMSRSGNYERDTYASLGGSGSLHGANGVSLVHDHNDSFSRGVAAVESYAAAKVAGAVTEHVTDSNNAADVAKVESANQAATDQAKIAAEAAAQAGKTGVTQTLATQGVIKHGPPQLQP